MGAGTGASLVGILPLLAAGFIFNFIFFTTRFRLSKADGQRLFFSCVVAGFALGCLAFVACEAVRRASFLAPDVRLLMDWLEASIPVPYGLTFVVTILVAIIAGHAANGMLWIRKKLIAPDDRRRVRIWAYWRAMTDHVTALDELVRRAVSDDALVMICLKSRKVYCGTISGVRGTYESAAAHIQIIPSFSIARDKDSLCFSPSSRTDYKAYGQKRNFDRRETLDNEIRGVSKAIRVFRTTAGGNDEKMREAMILSSLKARGRQLIAERKALMCSLSIYGSARDFDISRWLKVIPISEIESATLYFDDDYEKWFSASVRENGPVDTESVDSSIA